MISTTHEATNFQIFRNALREAPCRAKGVIGLGLVWAFASLVLLAKDLCAFVAGGDSSLLRHLGPDLGVAGMMLLAFAQLLHLTSQRPGEWCRGWRLSLP